jgi:predicted MFS family arabinose efflux permease
VGRNLDLAALRPAPGGVVSRHRRLLLLLGLALALDYADRSALGALGPDIKHAFGIGNTRFGLLAGAFSVVGAIATVPAGILADRMRRLLLLGVSIVLWSLAMVATGLAFDFAILLGARVILGVVTATARPVVASVTGDVFPRRRRGRALALIDSGELLGNGIGFLLAGVVAALLSWRGVFWLLAVLGGAVAYLVLRLPEPRRSRRNSRKGERSDLPLLQVVRYVLSIRTNVIVIVSVAIGYFFFAGVRTFGVIFITRAYGVGRTTADLVLLLIGVGAAAGLFGGGRIGDALIARGQVNGRLVVSSCSYLLAAVAFAPAVWFSSLPYGLPFAIVGGAALVGPTAPLDAVRLDVVRPPLRGRAEGIRNVLQIGAEAIGPVAFGALSDNLAGGGIAGMRVTFSIALGCVVVSALILLLARRYYPREATASDSAASAAPAAASSQK